MMTDIFLSFLGISVSVSLIVAALVVLAPVFNKRYAIKWKYLIWIFLAMRLLVPFSEVGGEGVTGMLPQTKEQAMPEGKETEALTDIRRIVVEIPAQMNTAISAQPEKSDTGITILDIVAFVWLTVCLIFIAIHFISYFHYKRLVMRQGKIIRDTSVLRQLFQLKRELHIRHTIRAIEYHTIESPMIIGFLKPVLVLPKEQYSTEELYFILKHELVHFKRGDVYWKLLFVTANAVHWFNPLIWIMQKEAAIDMELSCDESVIRGAEYAVRKAYTETLMSMLHKQSIRKCNLSTQFYGGTKIMKKRFTNILRKNSRKNGISMLVCTVILTIVSGMLVGCSIAKEESGKETTGNKRAETVADTSEKEANQTPGDSEVAEKNAMDDMATLIFSKEGEQEQKQAVLMVGDGYSIYLPEDEWQSAGPDLWSLEADALVRIWVTHFADESMDSVYQKLEEDGYATVQDYEMQKQEGDLISLVELKGTENDIWGVFYCYPTAAEEGWGRELPVIADTFALSAGAEGEENTESETASEYLGAEDCQEIEEIVDAFAAAYFDGDTDAMQQFLADTYEGAPDTYEGTGTISDLTVKGLSDADEKRIENGRCVVSLEFRDSQYEDMFLYLSFVFVRQADTWKIQFYGVEG